MRTWERGSGVTLACGTGASAVCVAGVLTGRTGRELLCAGHVRDCAPDATARAQAILDVLAKPPGAPNWYGEQRFGRDGDNAARGRAIVLGTENPDANQLFT